MSRPETLKFMHGKKFHVFLCLQKRKFIACQISLSVCFELKKAKLSNKKFPKFHNDDDPKKDRFCDDRNEI